ncbi:hypothetical protein CTI12_AA569060 [Artemisia annua]|uniref:Uncharacterized protein n=1 Tax=Artemisia annua TaxID=35608 RepID=A0A2U1KT14_ARTAN|nr:hypothetical protein CTI12_AA569060 [Artemisia annua]
MEDNISSENATSSKLETLQKEHDAKLAKISALKDQIESVKSLLDESMNSVSKNRHDATKDLSEKYQQLCEEYNSLLGQKSGKKQDN